MGLELTIQSLNQTGWPGASGRERADPRFSAGRGRDSNPARAQTPEEAQSYIEYLYKTGRTDELAALLRRSSVFRVAWQCLQQSASTNLGNAGELTREIPARATRPERPAPPTPCPGTGSAGRRLSPVQNLALRPLPADGEISPEIPEPRTYPVLSSRPTWGLAAARRVYETLARYFSQEKGDFPRISVRV